MREEILIVEDEALIAMSLKERLESFGYKVSGILDRGEDVISSIENKCPDLILMDINLKGDQDGIETAQMINEQRDIPILFLTSFSNKSVIDRAKNASPYGYVIKTIDDNNLHITIDIVLNKHREVINELNGLEKTIKKLNSLYDNNPNMVIRLESSGKVEYVNSSFAMYMGIQQTDIIGVYLENCTLSNKVISSLQEIVSGIMHKKQQIFTEKKLPTIMGSRYLFIHALPELNENSHVDSILIVMRDDTDQKIAADNMLTKQRKINESINYSMHIQNSIFPQLSILTSYFSNGFIINKPKDKIGGDFPWVNRVGESIYVAAVDCTGHGVPGALMSLVTFFLIDKINSFSREVTPGMMLDFLHLYIIRALKQHYYDSKSRDGADISLCKINIQKKVLEYAGAHRPLLLYRKGDLIEIKGDRYPIGGTQYKNRKRFVTNYLDLFDGDILLMFSDGLQDQFGKDQDGEIRKFGLRRIRELLHEKIDWDTQELSLAINEKLKKWRGSQSQLDDILVIGIKI